MAFKASNWWRNTSRCWARETLCFIVVRTRKNWRTSSKARQKRDAEATLPPTHGGIALLDATVILLQSIVEGAVGPVKHVTAQGLADGTRVGVMPIGCHPFWGVTNHIDGLRRSKR